MKNNNRVHPPAPQRARDGALALLRAGLIFAALFSASALAAGPPPAPVEVAPARALEIAPFVWVSGTVIGRYDARISAEVEGRLASLPEVGDVVAKGAPIALLDATSYRLALSEVEAEIAPIEALLAFYEREALRLERLAGQNNAAENRLERARADRNQALARIRASKARIAIAKDRLDKTRIRAPFAGVVTERLRAPGERVEAGDPVARLVDTGRLEIRARIRQQSVPFVARGDRLTLRDDDTRIEGEVRAVIPAGDDISRLYEIRILFEQPDWPIGKAVQVAAPLRPRQAVIAVPRDALVIRESGTRVYRVNADNMAELIPVETGVSSPTHIQVIGGVNENDRIVTRGNERLRPGQPVRIINGGAR